MPARFCASSADAACMGEEVVQRDRLRHHRPARRTGHRSRDRHLGPRPLDFGKHRPLGTRCHLQRGQVAGQASTPPPDAEPTPSVTASPLRHHMINQTPEANAGALGRRPARHEGARRIKVLIPWTSLIDVAGAWRRKDRDQLALDSQCCSRPWTSTSASADGRGPDPGTRSPGCRAGGQGQRGHRRTASTSWK